MRVLAIDLASRFSAACIMRDTAVEWCGTLDVGPKEDGLEAHMLLMEEYLSNIRFENDETLDRIIVEDLVSTMAVSALALRLQGATRHIIQTLWPNTPVQMIMASTWQRGLGYATTKGTTSKGWAKYMCQALDYEFDTEGMSAKSQTDVRDAILIARYIHERELVQ